MLSRRLVAAYWSALPSLAGALLTEVVYNLSEGLMFLVGLRVRSTLTSEAAATLLSMLWIGCLASFLSGILPDAHRPVVGGRASDIAALIVFVWAVLAWASNRQMRFEADYLVHLWARIASTQIVLCLAVSAVWAAIASPRAIALIAVMGLLWANFRLVGLTPLAAQRRRYAVLLTALSVLPVLAGAQPAFH